MSTHKAESNKHRQSWSSFFVCYCAFMKNWWKTAPHRPHTPIRRSQMPDYLHCQANQHKAQPRSSGQCGYCDEPLRFGPVWSEITYTGPCLCQTAVCAECFFFNMAESLPLGPKCKACGQDVEEAYCVRKIASGALRTNKWVLDDSLGSEHRQKQRSFQLVF